MHVAGAVLECGKGNAVDRIKLLEYITDHLELRGTW